MKRMPQPIPYQGSKRNIASQILAIMPDSVDKLVEPFAGSAAVSIRAAYTQTAQHFLLNDLNAPLMELLSLIINEPDEIADSYEELWNRQLGRERAFYNEARKEFNCTGRPDLFLYLLARCVKASVRYNLNGEFNQGPDNRRKGKRPDSMRTEILTVSKLLKGRTTITSRDFTSTLSDIDPKRDVVYMDPPYQGTSGKRDSRYCSGIQLETLTDFMDELNRKDVMFVLSYDGRKGAKRYGKKVPDALNLLRMEIQAGRSTQSTLLGRQDITYESLYLSAPLVDRVSVSQVESVRLLNENPVQGQLELSL